MAAPLRTAVAEQPAEGNLLYGSLWPLTTTNTEWLSAVLRHGIRQPQLCHHEQRDGLGSGSGGSATQGKRPPQKRLHLPDKVRLFEEEAKDKAATLKMLVHQNLVMKEREACLELSIAVAARQQERAVQVAAGLTHNPFAGLKSTVAEWQSITPSALKPRFSMTCVSLRAAFEAGSPLLKYYPHLLTPPGRAPRVPVHELEPCPDQASSNLAAVQPIDAEQAQQLESLRTAAKLSDAVVFAFRYVHLINPGVMLGMANNMQHTPGDLASWDDLAHRMQQVLRTGDAVDGLGGDAPPAAPDTSRSSTYSGSSPDGAECAGEGDPGLPALPTAPAGHWQQLMRKVALSDAQRLRAAVIADIICSGREAVAAQRARVMRQVLKQQEAGHEEAAMGKGETGPLSAGGGPPAPSTAAAEEGSAVYKPAGQLTAEAELLEKLSITMERERCLLFLGEELLWRHLLQPLQCAVVLGFTDPYLPDTMALLSAAADECTQEVLDRLAAPMMAQSC